MCCTVYVAAAQKSYLFLGFLAFLFPHFLEVFPRQGEVRLPQYVSVCICTFLWFRFISWQGGDHENCVNCDQWTQVTSIFLRRRRGLHGTIPTTCSVNFPFNQWQHLISFLDPYQGLFQLFFFFLDGSRVVPCLQSLSCFLCCVFFKVSVKSIDMLHLEHHLTADLTCCFQVLNWVLSGA